MLLANFDKSGFFGKVLSWEKSSGITHPKLSVQELQFKFWSQVEKRLQQLHYAYHLQMRENINAVDWFVFRNVNKIYSWTENLLILDEWVDHVDPEFHRKFAENVKVIWLELKVQQRNSIPLMMKLFMIANVWPNIPKLTSLYVVMI